MQLAGLAAILGALASTSLSAETVERMAAPAARQGVAVDSRFLYAVDNGAIAKYDRKTGRQVAQWSGDPRDFPHINSCRVIGPELVCAASNYPATPMESRVEVFDPATMKHVRTIPLGHLAGSLTWVDRPTTTAGAASGAATTATPWSPGSMTTGACSRPGPCRRTSWSASRR
jgi:hypothetical protein